MGVQKTVRDGGNRQLIAKDSAFLAFRLIFASQNNAHHTPASYIASTPCSLLFLFSRFSLELSKPDAVMPFVLPQVSCRRCL